MKNKIEELQREIDKLADQLAKNHAKLQVADYTTRSNYQKNYAKANRDAINARKRAWRKMVKDSACCVDK